jgi:tetratricopeptide (TPR) repeat protein
MPYVAEKWYNLAMTAETDTPAPQSAYDALVRVVSDIEKTGNISGLIAVAEHGRTLYAEEAQRDPSAKTHQTGSELCVMQGRIYDRLARLTTDKEEKKHYLSDALGMVTAGIDIARKIDDKRLLPVPLTFKGDLLTKQGDLKEAEQTYQEVIDIDELPENQTRAFLLNVKRRLALVQYRQAESTEDKAEKLQAAKDAIEALKTFQNEPGQPELTDQNRNTWVTGGHLDIAEAIVLAKDEQHAEEAFMQLKAGKEIIEKNDLTRRKEDLASTIELMRPMVDEEFAYGQTLRNSGEEEKLDQALRVYKAVEDHAVILGDKIMQGHALQMRGVTMRNQEKYEEADTEYEKAQKLFEEEENKLLQAAVLRDRSLLALKQGAYEKAHELIEKSITLLKQVGNAEHLGMSYVVQAQVFGAEKRIPEAEAAITEGIHTVDRNGDTYFRSHARTNAAEVLIDIHETSRAEALLTEAEGILVTVEQKDNAAFISDRNKIARLRKKITDQTEA